MSFKRWALSVLAALSLVFGSPANAALLGSTSGLVDTDTGLEWLDVVVNENLSYNQMLGSDLNGYGSLGFRYATVLEVGQLFENAGATLPPLGGFSSDPANQPAGDLLISFLGANGSSPSNTFIQAFSGTVAGPGTLYAPWIRGSGVNGLAGLSYGQYQPLASQSSSSLGHWLVRDALIPVPLPAALPLLAGALGLLGFIGWRRKHAAA